MCVCAADLWDDPQTLPQAVEADVSDILPRDVDVPLLGLVEAEQQAHNGALPASRRGTNCQREILSARLRPPRSALPPPLTPTSGDKTCTPHTNEAAQHLAASRDPGGLT